MKKKNGADMMILVLALVLVVVSIFSIYASISASGDVPVNSNHPITGGRVSLSIKEPTEPVSVATGKVSLMIKSPDGDSDNSEEV